MEELCEVLVGLFFQLVEETGLNSSLQCGDCSPKLGIICKVPETAHYSSIQIVNKDVGTLRDATRNQPQVGLCTVDDHPLSLAVQPTFHPTYNPFVQFIISTTWLIARVLQEMCPGCPRPSIFSDIKS